MSDPTTPMNGARGGVRTMLRAEGLAFFLLLLLAYRMSGAGWGLFAALFLLPDAFILPYLWSRRAGTVAYNAAHSYVAPALLAVAGLQLPGRGMDLRVAAIIWGAHIAFDRALGYGLKYESGFGDTHLGRVGGR